MKIYWNIQSHPLLASLAKPERKKLVQEACENSSVKKASGVGLAVVGLCAGLGAVLGDYFLPKGIWGAGIGGAIGGLLRSQIHIRAIARSIQESLNSKLDETVGSASPRF